MRRVAEQTGQGRTSSTRADINPKGRDRRSRRGPQSPRWSLEVCGREPGVLQDLPTRCSGQSITCWLVFGRVEGPESAGLACTRTVRPYDGLKGHQQSGKVPADSDAFHTPPTTPPVHSLPCPPPHSAPEQPAEETPPPQAAEWSPGGRWTGGGTEPLASLDRGVEDVGRGPRVLPGAARCLPLCEDTRRAPLSARGGGPPNATPEDVSAGTGSPAEWVEKDSGLDQSSEQDCSLAEESSLSLEQLLGRLQASLGPNPGWAGILSVAGLAGRLLEEREELLVEVKSLKETIRAERMEWLQFQSDLQVAVSVADRLKTEAEEELSALRVSQREALGRQAELERELKELRQMHSDTCSELSALKRSCATLELDPLKDKAVPGQGPGERPGPERQGPGERPGPERQGPGERPGPERQGPGESELRPHGAQTEHQRKGEGEQRSFLRLERTRETRSHDSKASSRGLKSQRAREWVADQDSNRDRCCNAIITESRRRIEGEENRDLRRETGELCCLCCRCCLLALPSRCPAPPRSGGGVNSLLRRHGGSKRNSLLHWCQSRTKGYENVDITNFSSSWADGLAFCALYHTYLPGHIAYSSLSPADPRENLKLAFRTGFSVGVPSSLTVEEMLSAGGPDWQRVLEYVESIYRHFEM
ncbi:CYTSA protein, partial [Atractosteus spatula]|nr:CYTSA protein [Atractosteus spatula]